jgi:hypothetical protein
MLIFTFLSVCLSVPLLAQQHVPEAQRVIICQMLDRATALADSLAATRTRDTLRLARIDSLSQLAFTAHHIALSSGLRLTAMMSKAASSAADKTRSAENILLFRMGVRDTKAFLSEAKKYCAGGE